MLNPKAYKISSINDIKNYDILNKNINCKKREFINFFCQIYSMHEVFKIFENYSIENNINYDYIIKLRFDRTIEDLSFNNYTDKNIFNINEDFILTLKHNFIIRDWFFILKNNEIAKKIYKNMWDEINNLECINKYIKNFNYRNKFVVDYLIKNNVNYFNTFI